MSNSMSDSQAAAHANVARVLVEGLERHQYTESRDAELYPALSRFDGMYRPAIPMKLETHRLLRAVAIKRAKKIPAGAELPSIGAVVEELVDRHRSELEHEAGALYKRELAKKR